MSGEEIKAEYMSSLADLTFNSKPLINVLTMLADENIQHASSIVEAVETHLQKVNTDVKLPILYLIDCIVKNVGGIYTELFSQNIVATFCCVFRVVDEKTRAEMFKLRQTWNDVFSPKKLYAIDIQIRSLDPAWPVTATPPSSIHLNPKFLKNTATTAAPGKPNAAPILPATAADPATLDMQQQLIQKQKELLELQQKKLELELLQTQVKLQEQFKQNSNLPKSALPHRAQVVASAGNPRVPTNANSHSGPRINPPSSALVAAATNRPIRDPRLLRQQNQQPLQKQQNANNVLAADTESKNTVLSSNKIVNNNKASVRGDPRMQNSITNNSNKDVPFQKHSEPPKPTRTFPKQSRSSEKSKSRNSKGNASDESKSLSSKSSSSSLDSPTKKSDKTSKISPSKRREDKKKDTIMTEKNKSSKRDKDSVNKPKSDKLTTDSKSAAKIKIFSKRNRTPSPVVPVQEAPPAAKDVDLRVNVEKPARIANEQPPPPTAASEKSATLPIQNKDVDLRQLPVPAVIGKKRPSTESIEVSAPKKSKTEIFDALFGNEDTDLRQLNVPAAPDRPPTPPAPIISSMEPSSNDSKESSPKKPNLDEVRAKLATAANKGRLMAKSFNKKYLNKSETKEKESPKSSNDTKIFISEADEQSIISGTLTREQEAQLMNKIIAHIETQKLKEAKKKEESLANISLQPISDDELEMDFSEGEDESKTEAKKNFGDKDERIFPPHLHNNNNFRENRRRDPNWRGRGRRTHWDNPPPMGPHPRPPIRPWLHAPSHWRPMGPAFTRPPMPDMGPLQVDLTLPNPPVEERKSPEGPSDILVESACQDDIKSMMIDGTPKDIRYYDEIAVVFINWDTPREISFQDGSRRVTFDEKDSYMLHFNEPYRDVSIGGSLHKVKLGGPSREIYIDYVPYECYFGGPGITIDLNGKKTFVKLDGPPPQVKIEELRTDLVAGKVNLIIDAKTIIPVFLDAKLQKFTVNGETHTLRFTNGLKTVLLDENPFDVQFGGLPKTFILGDKRYYIRFSVLPKGIKPGQVNIKGLECQQEAPASPHTDVSQDVTEPALPVFSKINKNQEESQSPENSNSAQFFQNMLHQQNLSNLDILSSVISSTKEPTSTDVGYSVENIPESNNKQEAVKPKPAPALASILNINDLFQKLVATGIVTTNNKEASLALPPIKAPSNQHHPQQQQQHQQQHQHQHQQQHQHQHHQQHHQHQQYQQQQQQQKISRRKDLNLKLVTFDKPETLKVRQNALYQGLYTGLQCSSCGMRFPPEQSMNYSQHLDWHFRQNRRGKKNIRVASSRKWYYSISDWKNYEEIEDLEEREKSYFDQQQSQAEGTGEDQEEDVEIPCVAAASDLQDTCEVCGDKFEIFFHEEKEEWQLKNAIRVEDKTYHPVCYEDYKASLVETSVDDLKMDVTPLEPPVTEEIIPGLEIILDDDEEENQNQDPHEDDDVIIAESDDDAKAPLPQKEEATLQPQEEDDDDDVIIKEEKIEKIVVEDDDDDDYVSTSNDTDGKNSVEIRKQTYIDDGFMEIGDVLTIPNEPIKIKPEPVDESDELPQDGELLTGPIEPEEEDEIMALEETELEEPKTVDAVPTFVPSIDGNVELESGIQTGVSGKIKINLNKPLPVIPTKENNKDVPSSDVEPLPEPVIDPSQPLPPGEEPILLNIKPALQGVELKKLPLVQKGSELTGMCSIM